MNKEAIKQALQYIEANAETQDEHEIAEGLRQAIAEIEKQSKPIAFGMKGEDGLILDVICPDEHAREAGSYTIPLYTHPKEWVRLTDDPVAFKIYKPTPPRHAIPNVRDAELPWVYDQDPSSGNVASMLVTPVKATPRPWVRLTDDEVSKIIDKVIGFNSCAGWEEEFARAIEAKLKDRNT
jgi:hypothetical protein